MTEFTKKMDIWKVDLGQRLIFGFAMVSKVDGEDFFDSQGDHIPEDAALDAMTDFMVSKRVGCTMHERDSEGQVVKSGEIIYAFPLLTDIAKSLGIETSKTGILIGYRPDNDEDLIKAIRGEFTGFSIGGARIEDEEA